MKICRSSRTVTLVVASALSGCLDFAHAGSTGFMGSTVEFTAHVSGLPGCGEVRSNPMRAVVGPHTEITSKDAPRLRFTAKPGCNHRFSAVGFAVDIDDRRIDISFQGVQPGEFGEAAFNGFRLRVVSGTAPEIVGAELTASHILSGQPDLSSRTRAPYGIDVNVSGLEYDQSSKLEIAVFFATLSVKEPLRVVYGRAIDAKQAVYTPTPEELLLVSIVDALGDDAFKREMAGKMRPEGTYELIDLFIQGGAYSERYIRELASEVAVSAFPTRGMLDTVLRRYRSDAFVNRFVNKLTDRHVVEPIVRRVIDASQQERTKALRELGDQIANEVYARVLDD